MQQGPTEKTIIEQCIRQRRPLPDAIANAPELFFGLELYYIAFFELRRGVEQNLLIQWLSIAQYAQMNQFSEEQKEDLFFFVDKMDEAFIKFHRPKDTPKK